MGWGGYGIYCGDGTQTCHLTFMERAGWKEDDDDLADCLQLRGTFLTDEMKALLKKNIDKVLKKMPKLVISKYSKNVSFRDENDAIEWQMLLALYLDNDIKPSKLIKDNGILATEYLMLDHSSDFDSPSRRRASLKKFIARAIAK